MLEVTTTGSGSVGVVAPGWSITEDSTPAAIGDSSGSVGSASGGFKANDDSVFLANNSIEMVHDSLGTFKGRVSSVDVQGLAANVSVAGFPEFLNANVTAPPIGGFTRFVDEFGDVGKGDGQWNQPRDVVFDSAGNMFVADYFNYRIVKFTPNGSGGWTYAAKVGSPGSGNGQFGSSSVLYLAVDPSNRILATDPGNNRVQRFTNSLVYDTQFGSGGTGNGQFDFPSGIAVDSTGAVYVTDFFNDRVQKFTSSLVYDTQWGTTGSGTGNLDSPRGITVSGSYVYVCDGANRRVMKYSLTGTFVATAGSAGTGPGQFGINSGGYTMGGIAVIGSNVYVVDRGGNRVHQFNTDLEWLGAFGSFGRGPGQFRQPTDVSAGTDGYLYVSDTDNQKIQRFDVAASAQVPLSAAIQTYVDLCAPGHTISYTAADDPDVCFPGWRGNVWAKLKELAAAYAVEIVTVNGTLTVRDIGSTALTINARSPVRITPSVVGGAQQINIVYQNPEAGDGLTFYTADRIHTVDVQQIVPLEIKTNHSPVVLYNPLPVDASIAAGEYQIQDSDGLPVPAETWVYYGGGVFPEIGDPGIIKVTLQGPSGLIPGFTGPFSFASGTDTDRVPQLSITGGGVITNPVTFELLTGADPSTTTSPVGATINNFAIGTLEQALDRGGWAAADAAGPTVTITFSMPVSELAGFGLDTGSRIDFQDSRYRVVKVEYGNVAAVITAARHVTLGEVDAVWAGQTLGDYDDFWDGFSAGDQQIRPLAA